MDIPRRTSVASLPPGIIAGAKRPLPLSPAKPSRQRPLCHPSLVNTAYTFYSYGHQPPMKAAKEVGCRRQPVRWRRSCIAAHFGAMWRRAGRQRAVAAEGMPGGTAGERRRGRRIGADVPALTSPDFVLTSGAQVAPTCGAVAGGHRRAGDARANGRRRGDVVPGPTKPVRPLSPPRRGASSRTCDRPQRPRTHPPSFPRKRESRVAARGALSYVRPPPATPNPPPTKPSRQRPPATQPASTCPATDPHDSQSKEANQLENQPPLFPPNPLQKSEKKLKDNPKWRIN